MTNKISGQEDTLLKWEDEHGDTSRTDDGVYSSEVYYEVDGTYSAAVMKQGDRVFYQEDIVCLHQAQLMAELFIRCDAALALAESLKCCGACGHYQTPLRLGHPETCAFDGVMTCGNYGPCDNWQPREGE